MCEVTVKHQDEDAQEFSSALLAFDRYQPAPIDLAMFGRKAGEIIARAASSTRKRTRNKA
jgi:hypothetical protein